jgi:hypothetical protein
LVVPSQRQSLPLGVFRESPLRQREGPDDRGAGAGSAPSRRSWQDERAHPQGRALLLVQVPRRGSLSHEGGTGLCVSILVLR